jgi:cytochrome c551/c552
MALNKDLLGTQLNDMAAAFNDQDISLEQLATARLNFWKGVAEQIISHFKSEGVINVTVATTGTPQAQTGTGTGTIS